MVAVWASLLVICFCPTFCFCVCIIYHYHQHHHHQVGFEIKAGIEQEEERCLFLFLLLDSKKKSLITFFGLQSKRTWLESPPTTTSVAGRETQYQWKQMIAAASNDDTKTKTANLHWHRCSKIICRVQLAGWLASVLCSMILCLNRLDGVGCCVYILRRLLTEYQFTKWMVSNC